MPLPSHPYPHTRSLTDRATDPAVLIKWLCRLALFMVALYIAGSAYTGRVVAPLWDLTLLTVPSTIFIFAALWAVYTDPHAVLKLLDSVYTLAYYAWESGPVFTIRAAVSRAVHRRYIGTPIGLVIFAVGLAVVGYLFITPFIMPVLIALAFPRLTERFVARFGPPGDVTAEHWSYITEQFPSESRPTERW